MLRKQILGHLKPALKPSPAPIIAGIVLLSVGLGVVRTQMPLAARVVGRDSVPVEGPLRVKFGQDVAPTYVASISPDAPGAWEQKRTPLGVSEADFIPNGNLQISHTYKVRITGLKRAITNAPLPDIEQAFTTEVAAGIKSISPKSNSKNVSIKPRFIVVQSDASEYPRKLSASLNPKVKLNQISDGQVMAWEPSSPLKQGTSYTFSVQDPALPDKNKAVVSSTFTTVTQPAIVSAREGDHFNKDQTVDIGFDQPMDTTQTAFKFDFAGKGSWVDAKTYRYVPEGISPGKTYKYTVKAGLRSKVGGVLEKDRPFAFATNGAVTASFSPGGGVAPNSPMHITFDQAVDHASAEKRFSVGPNVPGKLSWSGNTMTYSPSGEAYQTGYTFSVGAGVVPTWGLPSAGVLSGSYTTVAQVVKLNVPLYTQPYGRSCELTSLRMLLAYRGIQTSENAIVNIIGYNPRARNGDDWDNPNEMFVGFLSTFSWTQGYGVHAGPVARAAQSYGRSASAYFGVSAAFIAGQVYAGNPVEVWGHIGAAYADSWNTSSGRVNTTTSMHARVVYGVQGSADNPIGFYVNDAWTGSASYWSAGSLLGNMNAVPGVSNQAVVVF
ncbi:MAG TPA: C39 family peptidase [Candidatus Chromulinivoraceae bacterium]|nr:C39 family peptidase [Candidatus Chromulinivoraceae bacterium]